MFKDKFTRCKKWLLCECSTQYESRLFISHTLDRSDGERVSEMERRRPVLRTILLTSVNGEIALKTLWEGNKYLKAFNYTPICIQLYIVVTSVVELNTCPSISIFHMFDRPLSWFLQRFGIILLQCFEIIPEKDNTLFTSIVSDLKYQTMYSYFSLILY